MKEIKKRLSQYYYINQEVQRQSERLRRLRKKEADGIVADTVRGSMIQFPYIERVERIEGIAEDLTAVVEKQIDRSIRDGIVARIDTETIIAAEADPKRRELLRSRFIDCLTWEGVGDRNHIDPSHARKIVREWIKEYPG